MCTSSGWRVVGTKFLKIILNPKADRIRIPPMFTKRYGHDLPSRVFLNVPRRPTMEAELTRCDDGQTWIHKGWQEFKDSHSICFGYLLLFEYDGKSEFKVLIFDTSAVEIIYPFCDNNNVVANSDIDCVLQTYFSTPLLDYFGPNHIPVSYEFIRGQIDFVDEQILFARAQLEKFSAMRVKETWYAYQKAEDYVSSRARKNPFFISFMRKSYIRNKYNLNVSYPFARQNLPHFGILSIVLVTNGKEWLVRCRNEKCRAEFFRNGWRKFVQDNGIKLGDACVFEVADRIDSKGNELVWDRIPPEFARNRAGSLIGKVKLKIYGGPSWAVSVEKMEDGSIWFCKGWAEFIDDMKLKLFDFLIFIWCAEKSTFEVCGYGKNACAKGTFRRACGNGDEGSAGLENGADLKKEASYSDGEDEAKSGGSNPFFKIIMKPCHLYRLYVPKDFLLAAGLVGKEGVCLDYKGGHPVCVELIPRRTGCVEMVSGWSKFRISNKLVLGKSYMFEFIPSKMIIQVHGENGSPEDNNNSDADETKYPIHDKKRNGKGKKDQEIVKKRNGKAKNQENMRGISSRLKEERPNFDGSCSDVKETWDAYQKAEAFVSSRTPRKPCFISFMHKTYVRDKHSLNVPFPFGRRNLPHLGILSIVLVTDGKEWFVKCLKRERCAKLLTAGWRKFVQDNEIKLGDACVFEVADRIDSKGNELVWDVFIFRN
ncbi:B3 domain-containing protein [Striga asiatica]|uniref:B3 domain-containing protein n=1 Tax=Striga asiatica TaxID=4170 RepID=A0A5A7PDF9_STRAF|nr:B3 domain-containing protein [Striga asiatica]